MRRCFPVIVLLLAISTSSTTADAKDMCFSLPGLSGGIEYALRGFSSPSKNRCKPLSGFSTIAGVLLDGTACTSADGTTLRLALQGHPVGGPSAPFEMGCLVPLPSLAGGTCTGSYRVSSTYTGATSSIDPAPCVANVP